MTAPPPKLQALATSSALLARERAVSQSESEIAARESELRARAEELGAAAIAFAGEADVLRRQAAALARGAEAPVPIGRLAAPRPERVERVKVRAELDLDSDSNFYSGFSPSLDHGGLFVATVDLKEPGTQVDVQYTLPNGTRVETRGVVRWARE